MRVFILSVFVISLFTISALATESDDAPEKEQAPVEKAEDNKEKPEVDVKASNPHIQVMNKKARELAKKLTKEEALALGNIRENFGILRGVSVAQKSVGEAVALCAEKNPDLKDDMNSRYGKWEDAIGSVVKKQEKTLEESISKTHFQNPDDIKEYLGSIDDAAEYADDKIEKTIVTTPEACKNLMASMDNTQTVILDLISNLGWPSDAKDDGNASP